MSALNEPVMVLNKVWLKIRIIPAHRALVLLFAGKASAVDEESFYAYKWDEWVKEPIKETDNIVVSSSGDVRVPEIIVLATYNKTFKKNVKLTKKNIYIRDGNVCQYSGKKLSEGEFDIDHVNPRSKGGKNSWGNMVVCAKDINRKKADRTPEQAGLKLIRKPIKPSGNRLIIDPKIQAKASWSKF